MVILYECLHVRGVVIRRWWPVKLVVLFMVTMVIVVYQGE